MGNKGSKTKEKASGDKKRKADKTKDGKSSASTEKSSSAPSKAISLTEADYQFLIAQTGNSKDDVKNLFEKFMAGNPDAKLDKKEFVKLYTELRPENDQNLDEISEFVFKAFDSGI
jgi:hypothetical protein